MLLKRVLLFPIILLWLALRVYAQNVTQVYCGTTYLDRLQQNTSHIYFQMNGMGVVSVDKATGAISYINVTNSPLTKTSLYGLQVRNDDTLILTALNNWWLKQNGFWSNLGASTRVVVIANDGRIFRSDTLFDLGLQEWVNNRWQHVTDSFVHNDVNFGFAVNGNKEIYMIANNRTIKYADGVYTEVPWITDAVLGFVIPTQFYFDNRNNVYAKVTNNHGDIPRYYRWTDSVWSLLPRLSPAEPKAFFSDTANQVYFLLDSTQEHYIGNGIATLHHISLRGQINGVIKNYPLDTLEDGLRSGINGITGNGIDDMYIITRFNGAYHGGVNSRFARIEAENTKAKTEYLIYPENFVYHDSVYYRSYPANIGVFDTALHTAYLSQAGVSVLPSLDSTIGIDEFLFQDHLGHIWIPQNGNGLKDIITNTRISYPVGLQRALLQGVYDSNTYWVIDESDNYNLVANGNITSLGSLPYGRYSYVDASGNLWLESMDQYAHIVYRLSVQGGVQQMYYHNSYSNVDAYDRWLAHDDKGDMWVRDDDTLIRYRGNSQMDSFKMTVPHDYISSVLMFRVFDSTEIVLVSWDNICYYHNGQWQTVARRFQGSGWNSLFSRHDGRLVFLTEEDGIQVYDFNAPAFHNGNRLQGEVYNDENADHHKQQQEFGFPHQTVTINGDVYSTNQTGVYGVDVYNGSYTIQLNTPPYFTAYPDSYVVHTTSSFNTYDTLNFACVAAQPVNDLSINLSPDDFGYGMLGTLFFTVRNNGSTVQDATVVLQFDTNLVLYTPMIPPASRIGGNITLPLGQLYPFQEIDESIAFWVDTNLVSWDSIDTLLHFKATIYPIVNDTTPANNTDTVTTLFLRSHDPNYKTVQPAGLGLYNTVDTGQVLTYTIYFQNNGNAPAINIVIKDTLDAKLDISTFNYVGSSHVNSFHIAGRVLTVEYDNVYLPDSADNPPGSHGFFKYSIRAKAGVQYQQTVNNSAAIYFDLNSAVLTNTVTTTYGPVVYLQNTDTVPPTQTPTTTVNLFPNPATGMINYFFSSEISLPGVISLFDATGKQVLSQALNSSSGTLPLNFFASGVYVIKVTGNSGKTLRLKFVKD